MYHELKILKRSGRIFILFIFLASAVFPAPVRAGYWGEEWMATFWQDMSGKIWAQMQAVILTNVKMLVINAINRQVEGLVGGVNGSGALFITNWEQYLIKVPEEENKLYMNDLLSQSTRGKCSGLNYESIAKGKFDMNYISTLCQSANFSSRGSDALLQVTIDQYSSAPLKDIQEGNWRTLNAMFNNPANNPFGFSMMAWEAQQKDLARRQEQAKTKAIAGQGFTGVEVNGVTVTPGRTVADLIQNVKTLGNNVLANAKDPGEFIGGVIGAVANQVITQMLQKGFDQVNTAIAREQNKFNKQIKDAAQDINKQLGPASQYIKGVNQLTGTANAMYGTVGGSQATNKDKGCAGTASGYGGC